jgi:hypothetical protein
MTLFKILIGAHILFGAIGLIAFWVPVVARKGGDAHRKAGKVFAISMLLTGTIATGMSTLTILWPVETHPHLTQDPEWIRAIFGWTMLCLAALTVNLAWYGWLCVCNQRHHERNRAWHNVTLQVLLLAAAVAVGYEGLATQQPLMYGVTALGIATVATNLRFMLDRSPPANLWLKEHVKAIVGAGISVYTAFLAFGAVRTFPALALNPLLWAVPLIVGLSLILVHQRRIDRASAARLGRTQPAS